MISVEAKYDIVEKLTSVYGDLEQVKKQRDKNCESVLPMYCDA